MADLGWPELSIIVIAFVLLFGWKKMPDMARSLGRSARIFKSEVDQMHTDASAGARTGTTTASQPTYAAGPASLADAEARAVAAEAELASRRADAEVARLRAERDALDRTSGSR